MDYTSSYSKIFIGFLPGEARGKPLNPTRIKNKTKNKDIVKMVINVDRTRQL